jgi:hypothetical protein
MTSISKNSLHVAARQILRRLRYDFPTASVSLAGAMLSVAERYERLQRTWRLLLVAERRQWHVAVRQLSNQLQIDSQAMHHRTDDLWQRQNQRAATQGDEVQVPPLRPCLRSLIEELCQLEEEFTQVEYRPREQVIVAHTEPIELEGLYLGPFAIELHAKRLSHPADSGAFRCTALEPRPASRNELVTHPHVNDGGLCAGDASVPLATALQQGRICDAFCLVRAVLAEYNAHSPYVPIEDWEGVRCQDCDASVSRDELFYCEDCQRDVCSDCNSSCEVCEDSCCRGCLERDAVSRRSCCTHCRHSCDDCGRTVDADSYVTQTQLCPECDEQHRLEEEEEKERTTTDTESEDDEHEHNAEHEYESPAAAEADSGGAGDGATADPASRPPATTAAMA